MSKKGKEKQPDVVQLFGRDEMNLVEIPFGPITPGETKTLVVEHEAFDRQTKRFVTRQLLMTGSDAFGLPRPIDDVVLVGMKALTCELGFRSRHVEFSAYQLFKLIGWPDDGRSYGRLEASFDRILGTNLKFKDFWWDKREKEWKSKAFHLIEDYELCSRNRFDRARLGKSSSSFQLCSFTWSDVIWKSFSDGYIKKLDMEMFRRVSSGRSKEVAVRLYRVLDKRFYKKQVCDFKLARLCKGIIGLHESYCPYEMKRVLARAANWLIECGFISEMEIRPDKKTGELMAVFRRASRRQYASSISNGLDVAPTSRKVVQQFEQMNKEKQKKLLDAAIRYCDENQPDIVVGYRRNEGKSGEAAKAYLELILHAFVKSRGNGVA